MNILFIFVFYIVLGLVLNIFFKYDFAYQLTSNNILVMVICKLCATQSLHQDTN